MKKFLALSVVSVMTVCAFGVLVGCGGQTELSGKEREEVLAAVSVAEFSALEVKMSTETKATQREKNNLFKSTISQELTMLACEQAGQINADLFMSVSTGIHTVVDGIINDDSADLFAISFLRGDDAYIATDSWKKIRAEKGDYEALIEEYRVGGDTLEHMDGIDYAYSDLGTADATSYLEFSEFASSTVYRNQTGYRIDFDFVVAAGKIFEKLNEAAPAYAAFPDMTVAKLFETAGLSGMEAILFGGATETKAFEIFGSPQMFSQNLREAAEDPERFLLEKVFGLNPKLMDEWSFVYTATVVLNRSKEITGMGVALCADGNENLSESKGKALHVESKITFTILENAPELTELAGLRVDMGYFVAPGTYEFNVRRWFSSHNEGDFEYSVSATGKGFVTFGTDGTAEITLTATASTEYMGGETIGTWMESHTLAIPSSVSKSECLFFESFPVTWKGETRQIETSGLTVKIERSGSLMNIYLDGICVYQVPTEHQIITLGS